MKSPDTLSQDEYLQRESQLAREGLLRLRGEMLDSLSRSVDVSAWTARFPWASLGTAAVAGVATGWAVGRTFRGSSKPDSQTRTAADLETSSGSPVEAQSIPESPHAAARLVGGLGTLAGTLAAAVATAAAEALGDVVKETIHDSLHPEPPTDDEEVNG